MILDVMSTESMERGIRKNRLLKDGRRQFVLRQPRVFLVEAVRYLFSAIQGFVLGFFF